MNIFMVQNPRQPKICDVCHKYNQEEPEPSAFWGQICCAEHYNDNTPWCRECLRFKQGDIPILMVDQDELNRVNRLYEPAYDKPKPDGLMLLGPPFPTNPVVTIQRCSKRGERIQVKKKVDKLTMLQYLPGIFRQPDVVIVGILAHEMMHAWLALRLGLYRKLETWVEEGICRVMEYMWMEWFCSSSAEYFSYKTKEQVQYIRWKPLLSIKIE